MDGLRLAELTGRDRRVLDLGCGQGEFAALLVGQGCQVVGIEGDADAAKLAEVSCERVVHGDLDTIDLELTFGDDRFDVIVASGVLPHLKDPQRLLGQLAPLLRPEGYLLVNLPNVAHGSVRLALLNGEFPYAEGGLLSHDTLRFVTRESALELFGAAGWTVVHLETSERDISDSEVSYPEGPLTDSVIAALDNDPLARVYSYTLLLSPDEPARLSPPLALVADLGRRVLLAEAERADAVAERVAADARCEAAATALHTVETNLAVAQLGLRDREIHHLRETHRVNGLSRDQQIHNRELLGKIVDLEAALITVELREAALIEVTARLDAKIIELTAPSVLRRTARAVRTGRARDIVLDAISPGRRPRA